MIRHVARIFWFQKKYRVELCSTAKNVKNVLAYEKYAVAMPEANFAQYLIEAKAKRAPTKFAKCFRKQEEVDHDTKLALARSCLMQTYNSSKKQQLSAVLLRALLLLL